MLSSLYRRPPVSQSVVRLFSYALQLLDLDYSEYSEESTRNTVKTPNNEPLSFKEFNNKYLILAKFVTFILQSKSYIVESLLNRVFSEIFLDK